MSFTREEIQQLSVPERLELINVIWDTLVDSPDALPVSEAQRLELDRRLEAHQRNPEAGIDWEQLREQLRK